MNVIEIVFREKLNIQPKPNTSFMNINPIFYFYHSDILIYMYIKYSISRQQQQQKEI